MAEGDGKEFDANWGDSVGPPDEELPHLHIPTPEEAEALNSSDPAAALEPIEAEAAFLVYLDPNGHWCGDSALINRPVIVQREAGLNDYRHACADMSSDLLAAESAGRAATMTLQLQQQLAVQMMQQKQAADIAAATGVGGGGVDLATLQKMAAKGGRGGPIIPGR